MLLTYSSSFSPGANPNRIPAVWVSCTSLSVVPPPSPTRSISFSLRPRRFPNPRKIASRSPPILRDSFVFPGTYRKNSSRNPLILSIRLSVSRLPGKCNASLILFCFPVRKTLFPMTSDHRAFCCSYVSMLCISICCLDIPCSMRKKSDALFFLRSARTGLSLISFSYTLFSIPSQRSSSYSSALREAA